MLLTSSLSKDGPIILPVSHIRKSRLGEFSHYFFYFLGEEVLSKVTQDLLGVLVKSSNPNSG